MSIWVQMAFKTSQLQTITNTTYNKGTFLDTCWRGNVIDNRAVQLTHEL